MRAWMLGSAMMFIGMLRIGAAELAAPKEVVLSVYREVFNQHDISAIDRLLTEDCVDHNPDPGQAPGRAGIKAALAGMIAAFPDLKLTPEQVLVDGNFVTVRSTVTGTQKGEFMGMPASHKSFRVALIDILEVKNGKVTQRWGLMDAGAMMTQLAPPAAPGKP